VNEEEDDDSLIKWGPNGGVVGILIPFITSLGFLALTWILAAYMPLIVAKATKALNHTLKRNRSASLIEPNNSKEQETSYQLSDSVFLLLLFITATLLTLLASLVRSTPLLGCFMAGVTFASVDGALGAWERYSWE
jgi:hypothetical protein